MPSAQQMQAVFWLAVLTLPVFAAAAAFTYLAAKTSVPALLAGSAFAGGAGVALIGLRRHNEAR